nr:hypothetical protein [Sinorhizobium medicae]
MRVHYEQFEGNLRPYYICNEAVVRHAGKACQWARGPAIDEAVSALLLDAMAPTAIEVALAVQEEISQRVEQAGDCQEFCAVGHDDEKERIITWLSRKNFWTSSWLDVIHPRFSARTVCWTI